MKYFTIYQTKQEVIAYLHKNKLTRGIAYYDPENQHWFELELEFDEDFGEEVEYCYPVPEPLPYMLLVCVF